MTMILPIRPMTKIIPKIIGTRIDSSDSEGQTSLPKYFEENSQRNSLSLFKWKERNKHSLCVVDLVQVVFVNSHLFHNDSYLFGYRHIFTDIDSSSHFYQRCLQERIRWVLNFSQFILRTALGVTVSLGSQHRLIFIIPLGCSASRFPVREARTSLNIFLLINSVIDSWAWLPENFVDIDRRPCLPFKCSLVLPTVLLTNLSFNSQRQVFRRKSQFSLFCIMVK